MAKKIYSCGLDAALAVVGGKWKSLILWNLAHQPCRFGELRRLVVGVSEKMLIQELKELIADRIITRKDFHEVPPRVEYALNRTWPLPGANAGTSVQRFLIAIRRIARSASPG